jgi:lysocardiolipin and lysophospholipid acyltransferase
MAGSSTPVTPSTPSTPTSESSSSPSPSINSRSPGYGLVLQTIRCVSLVLFFLVASLCIHGTQLVGFPLAYVAPDIWHAWIDLTKQSFGILLTAVSQYWTPCTMHMTGDSSVLDLLSVDPKDGTLITSIGDRAVIIANHQLYSDWVYLWWFAFTAKAHGGVYILLKDSLKWIPIFGWGMQFFNFIFLSRKWVNDETILDQGVDRLRREKEWPAWLLLFPEGTTFSRNGVAKSVAYGKKADLDLPQHLLLPRSRGLRHSILKLDSSIEYLYDATIHYSGIPKGVYGEDYFTLRNMYLRGKFSDRVDVYWRRYRIADIPYHDEIAFEKWVLNLWYEKDALLEKFEQTGSFLDAPDAAQQIQVPVRLKSPFELFQIFSIPLNVIIIVNLLRMHLPSVFRT